MEKKILTSKELHQERLRMDDYVSSVVNYLDTPREATMDDRLKGFGMHTITPILGKPLK